MAPEPSPNETAFNNAKQILEDYYQTARRLHEARSEILDRTILSLSGGALALSITLLSRPNSPKCCIWILILSWLCLTASLLAVVLSLKKSTNSSIESIFRLAEAVNNLEEKKEDVLSGKLSLKRTEKPFHIPGVKKCLFIALWGCVIGIGLLGLFAVVNIAAM